MNARQQKAYEAIRACLLRDAATDVLVRAHRNGTACLEEAIEDYADEAARTLVGVMDELQNEDAEDRAKRDEALNAEVQALREVAYAAEGLLNWPNHPAQAEVLRDALAKVPE